MRRKNNRRGSLGSLGELGFLRQFLPRLKRFQASRFAVPPGDDAAVLNGRPSLVLSIDGLTEGTHFRLSWARRVERLGGFRLGRGLGWKLLGSAISDLAAMGQSERRWAMIYLGAAGSLPLSFLNDFYQGLREKAALYKCALAGGDTVRARDTTLVAAVGADQSRGVSFRRDNAQPGEIILIAGSIGDASIGLRVLEQGPRRLNKQAAAYFVRRFFDHTPQLDAAEKLARAGRIRCAMDVSDSVQDTINTICEMSNVGAVINVDRIPVSRMYRRFADSPPAVLAAGENYALLFSCAPKHARTLAKLTGAAVVGLVTPAKTGARYFLNGKPIQPPPAFSHYA
jgi:thiamine-monophosphate kinase